MAYSEIEPLDEELHAIGEGENWQESWYFNWADERHNVFGLTRIGYRFRQKQIDGLILTIRNGNPEYLYPAVKLPYHGDWAEITAKDGLRAKNLVLKTKEPLKKWQLLLEGKDAMDLTWEAYTPVFDFHAFGQDIPANITGRHFEQSGTVKGWTRFNGHELEINGFGQRDKSWGVRDWAEIEGWNWISAQFDEDFAFNVWEGFLNGKVYHNGFIFIDGENFPVEKVLINFKWGKYEHLPLEAGLEIYYRSGNRSGNILKVNASAMGHFPLAKKGLWIQESHAQFTAELKGKRRKGIGVIEHAYHVGILGTLIRLPRMPKALIKAMVPF